MLMVAHQIKLIVLHQVAVSVHRHLVEAIVLLLLDLESVTLILHSIVLRQMK